MTETWTERATQWKILLPPRVWKQPGHICTGLCPTGGALPSAFHSPAQTVQGLIQAELHESNVHLPAWKCLRSGGLANKRTQCRPGSQCKALIRGVDHNRCKDAQGCSDPENDHPPTLPSGPPPKQRWQSLQRLLWGWNNKRSGLKTNTPVGKETNELLKWQHPENVCRWSCTWVCPNSLLPVAIVEEKEVKQTY